MPFLDAFTASPRHTLTTILVVIFVGAFVLMLSISFHSEPTPRVANCNHNEHFETPKSLRMVSILFRHGHRSPIFTYPKDPYINYTWDGGLGALSRRGVKKMYDFGKTLRTRYGGLIKDHCYYSTEVMQFNSSDADRCLKSAASLIAGLLPPPIDDEHNLPFQWQPVPIHTSPVDQDKTILTTRTCPRYNIEFEKVYQNMTTTDNIENNELMTFVTKNSGYEIMNKFDMYFIRNALELEKMENLKLPKWTENGIYEKITEFVSKGFLYHTMTPFMKRIKGGPLITAIRNNMIKNRDRNDKRKLYLYAGHDRTLIAVMDALNIVNQTTTTPDFGSALAFELHNNPNIINDVEVKIFYYFSYFDKNPKHILIPECPVPCPLKQFTNNVKSLIVDDYDLICKL